MPPFAGVIPAKGQSFGQQFLPALLMGALQGARERTQEDYEQKVIDALLSGQDPRTALRPPQKEGIGGVISNIIAGKPSVSKLSPFTQAFMKRYALEPEYFTLGGGAAPEERYAYDPTKGQSTKIATGPTPPVKAQAGRGMVFQNDEGEYRYGVVNLYTGDVIRDLRHATEADLQKARTEGTLAATEKTRAGTEKIYDDMVLNQLKEERAQTRDESSIKNIDSMIKNREEMLGIRQKESEARIDLTQAKTDQAKKDKPNYSLLRMRQSHLQQNQKLLFAELHDVLNPPTPERATEIRAEMTGINDELGRLPEIQSQQSTVTAPSEAKTQTPPTDRQSLLAEYKRLGSGQTRESRDFADKYLLQPKTFTSTPSEPNLISPPANFESNLGNTDFSKPPPQQQVRADFVPRNKYKALAAKYGLAVDKSDIAPGFKRSVPEIEGIPYYKLWLGTATLKDFEEATALKKADELRNQTDPMNRRMPWQPVR